MCIILSVCSYEHMCVHTHTTTTTITTYKTYLTSTPTLMEEKTNSYIPISLKILEAHIYVSLWLSFFTRTDFSSSLTCASFTLKCDPWSTKASPPNQWSLTQGKVITDPGADCT